MEKYEDNGRVAVLVSVGYGAGWSTWNDGFEEELAMDARLVECVMQDKGDEYLTDLLNSMGLSSVYTGGYNDLEVVWVDKGSRFRINEYDGYENIIILEGEHYMTA